MNTAVVQKAVVLNKKGEVLMLRRSKTDVRRPSQWDLPGGLHEENETLEETIIREIQEETGLAVGDLTPIYSKTEIRQWSDNSGEHSSNVVFIFYLGRAESDKVKLSYEHDKFQWQSIRNATKEFEYYLHKELLKHILDNQLA